jgi:S1-C subfamily serine protease
MDLPVSNFSKRKYKYNINEQLKRRRLYFFILLMTLPLAIGIMETIGADYTKQEVSESLTEPVAYVNTGNKTGTAFLTGPTTLITAKHVVSDVNVGDEVELRFMERNPEVRTKAKVIWKSKSDKTEDDFAVLRLNSSSDIPDDMPVLTIGDSDDISEGDEIIAVGYPAGISSFTKGVISSITLKTAEGEYDLIKVDVQIHHGSSGGPIILSGTEEVIGLAEAGLSGDFQGINFATKINRLIEATEMAGIDIYE